MRAISSVKLSEPEEAGRKMNRFELLKDLGEGSEGEVKLAKDTETGELVALKRIFSRPEINKRLEREIDILNTCRHKNVIQFKRAFQVSGEPYMVFEFMDYDLSTLNQRVCLSPLQIKIVMKQVLEGLAHCHANRVLHLDIKPANILVNDSGVVKVADFGLSSKIPAALPDPHYKVADFGLSSKISAALPDPHYVGTPEYTAPELLMGSTNYGPAVDIWSLGCVFAEMLDRKLLFAGCECNTSECSCNIERLVFQHIVEVCGTPKEDGWPGLSNLPDFKRMVESVAPATSSERTLRKRFQHVEDRFAIDLLERMIVLNPAERITAEEALEAEYFTGPKQSQVQCCEAPEIIANRAAIHCY